MHAGRFFPVPGRCWGSCLGTGGQLPSPLVPGLVQRTPALWESGRGAQTWPCRLPGKRLLPPRVCGASCLLPTRVQDPLREGTAKGPSPLQQGPACDLSSVCSVGGQASGRDSGGQELRAGPGSAVSPPALGDQVPKVAPARQPLLGARLLLPRGVVGPLLYAPHTAVGHGVVSPCPRTGPAHQPGSISEGGVCSCKDPDTGSPSAPSEHTPRPPSVCRSCPGARWACGHRRATGLERPFQGRECGPPVISGPTVRPSPKARSQGHSLQLLPDFLSRRHEWGGAATVGGLRRWPCRGNVQVYSRGERRARPPGRHGGRCFPICFAHPPAFPETVQSSCRFSHGYLWVRLQLTRMFQTRAVTRTSSRLTELTVEPAPAGSPRVSPAVATVSFCRGFAAPILNAAAGVGAAGFSLGPSRLCARASQWSRVVYGLLRGR